MNPVDTTFTTSDGHRFSACVSQPEGTCSGLVILIQEIFGLTGHLCGLTRTFASRGYTAAAPALFDRIQRGLVLEYNEAGADQGRQLIAQLQPQEILLDIQALIDTLGQGEKVAVIGYCWGGSIAYLAASRLPVDAAIAYYGTRIHQMLEMQPRCPILFHFGERDRLVPMEVVERIRSANPGASLYTYPDAGHAFNCAPRASFHPASAQLALDRSLAFLRQHLAD